MLGFKLVVQTITYKSRKMEIYLIMLDKTPFTYKMLSFSSILNIYFLIFKFTTFKDTMSKQILKILCFEHLEYIVQHYRFNV